jgi:sugar phosphate isomerase/epimerase
MGTGIGIAVDVYHTWWDPELKSQIKRAGKERLLAFHLSDWLMETKHLLLDRGMMGDGVIDISRIRKWMESESFEMLNEVEIFSEDNWWKRDPDELIRTCVERLSVC